MRNEQIVDERTTDPETLGCVEVEISEDPEQSRRRPRPYVLERDENPATSEAVGRSDAGTVRTMPMDPPNINSNLTRQIFTNQTSPF